MSKFLERFAEKVTHWLGSNAGFATAVGLVVAWAACGPFFDYSSGWQLVINTGTTIITFLVVFLLQRSQNKESRALQLKLNEIVAALDGASNHLIAVENLGEAELERLSTAYLELARQTSRQKRAGEPRSIEESSPRILHAEPEKRGSRGTKSASSEV